MINVELEDYDEIVGIYENSKPTAKYKFQRIADVFERENQNPYGFVAEFQHFMTAKDYNELIDAGEFKNPNNKHSQFVVEHMFKKPAQDQDMLKAQAKIIIDHDFELTNSQLRKHFNSAINLGETNYLEGLMQEPKLEHVFYGYKKSMERMRDERLTSFEREQASQLAKEAFSESPYGAHSDKTNDYSPVLTTIAHTCLVSIHENNLTAKIVQDNPVILDKLTSNIMLYDDNKFAKLIDNEDKFNSVGKQFQENIYKECKDSIRSESMSKSLNTALQFVKHAGSDLEEQKQSLINTAIKLRRKDFLNDVALKTNLRFNESQIEAMNEQPEIFKDVLHNNSKKELHDKLMRLPPKQKTKTMKI